VTTVPTLEKGFSTLESACTTENTFDVALVEGKLVESLLPPAGAPDVTPATAAQTVRFTQLAREVAIVLMHEAGAYTRSR